ncbi:MAG TPA: phage tail sheath C-terminal domain-containing protein [Gemmataceae bacterium]|jgi:hypothetical protein|nr:phage tail sheath C-terminal domain-containing protein [Gemmataceae bacterium]
MPELLHPGVYTFEVSSGVRPIEGVSTSTAAFIGNAEKGPIPGTILPNGRMAQPEMVTSLTEYFRRYGGFRKDSYLTYAVRAFYDNGGRRAYIVRVAPKPPAGPNPGNAIVVPTAATTKIDTLAISAANQGEWGKRIWIRIAESSDKAENDDKKANHFKLQVLYGTAVDDPKPSVVETFDNVDWRSAELTYVQTVVNSRSEFIAITNDNGLNKLTARPKFNQTLKANGDIDKDEPAQLKTGGLDAKGITEVDCIGIAAADNTVTGTGLHALDKINDVNIIAIPGFGSKETVRAGMEYCKNSRPLQDCFFIGDAGVLPIETARTIGSSPSVSTIRQARDFADDARSSFGDFGAVYFPWVLAADPIGVPPNPRILLPPSGFLAGIYARVDNSRGVFKAPAGTLDSGVAGALAVATSVSDIEQDQLNPKGMNVVRLAPAGGGIVVWGTRTIGNDPEWRYIPVRRMAIFLRVSIYYGIQWAVFEPNDEPLWSALRLNIRAFMLTQFRAGAFQGSKPDDAFFVRCDATTTTQQDIDNGVVNILVGFAPLKPAEFVVLKLSQKVNQPAG